MGNPAGSDGLSDEQPQRLVYTGAFRIDRYEITHDAYARFVQMTGHIQGNNLTADIVSASCNYTFQTRN